MLSFSTGLVLSVGVTNKKVVRDEGSTSLGRGTQIPFPLLGCRARYSPVVRREGNPVPNKVSRDGGVLDQVSPLLLSFLSFLCLTPNNNFFVVEDE